MQSSNKNNNEVGLNKFILLLILSVASACALSFKVLDQAQTFSLRQLLLHVCDVIGSKGALSLTIVSAALFCCAFFGESYFANLSRRKKNLTVFFSFVVSCSLVIPGVWGQGQESNVSFPWYTSVDLSQASVYLIALYIVEIALCTWAFSIIIASVIRAVKSEKIKIVSFKARVYLERINFSLSSIIKLALVIFGCWIPILVINGPVCIPMDSMVQLIQVRGFPAWDPMMMIPLPGYWFSDHNPALDTIIYGAFDFFGRLFNSELFGLRLYTWVWAFFASVSLSAEILWVKSRFKLPTSVLFICVALISFIPACSSYMTILMKDSTWIPFYVLWMVAFEELCYRVYLNKKIGWKFVLFSVCLTVLAGLTKKTSIYISVLSLLTVLISANSNRIKILFSLLFPAVVVLFLVPAFIFPLLRIAPGGGQEMLGTPIQQTVYVVSLHQSEIEKKDIDTISRVVDLSSAKQNWNKATVDPAKQSYKSHASTMDKLAFIGLWVKLLIHYPLDCVNAVPFLRNFFLLGPTYYTNGALKNGWEPSGGYAILPQFSDCELSWAQEHLSVPLINFLNKTPVLMLLGAEVLYTLWLPLAVLCVNLAHRKKVFIPMAMPFLFTYLTMLMLPAYQTRYSISFLFCFIFLIAFAFPVNKNTLC